MLHYIYSQNCRITFDEFSYLNPAYHFRLAFQLPELIVFVARVSAPRVFQANKSRKHPRTRTEKPMLGWLTMFALLALCSLLTMQIGKEAIIPAVTASVLFTVLFILCLLTRVVRGRA